MSNPTMFSSSFELPNQGSFNVAPVLNLSAPQVGSASQPQQSLPGGAPLLAGQNFTYSIGAPFLQAAPQLGSFQPQSSFGGVPVLNLSAPQLGSFQPQSSFGGVPVLNLSAPQVGSFQPQSSVGGIPVPNLSAPQVGSASQPQLSWPAGVPMSVFQPLSSVGGAPLLNLTSQLLSGLQPKSSLPAGVAGQNSNSSYPIFYGYPSNNAAKPTASQSNPGMNINYTNLGSYVSYPSNTNTTNGTKPTAIESIREIKRHLALLETPTSDAKPMQAEINLLIGEIKLKVNSLESAIKRDDFDFFSRKLDHLLKQIELNTTRPSFGEPSNTQSQSYLISDGDTICALADLIDRNVFSQNIDSRLEFMHSNSNRIIALLAAQLDCILSTKLQYFSDMNLLLNFKVKIVSNIEAILSLISKVLKCLEHSKDILADETLSKLMESLLPLKMIESQKKSQPIHTLHNPTSSASIKSILASALFLSASKWFVSPSALLATSLKLIRELTFEASVTTNSSTNKYLLLLKIHEFVLNNEEQSKDKNLALETFCHDFGLLIKQMSDVELDETRLDAILLDIYLLSQHDPGFKLLKPSDADVAMFSLLDLITNQFGERIWDHFALVDQEIEKQSAQLGDSNKVWLLNYLKWLGYERKDQTCQDSSKVSTLASASPDLQQENDNIVFIHMNEQLSKSSRS